LRDALPVADRPFYTPWYPICRTAAVRIFSSATIQVFDGLCSFGHGNSETMALKRDRIRIEVFEPPASPETARSDASRADEAILILARLIGRQIAREHFERSMARERKGQRSRTDSRLP